jgi:hypothetical protein
MRPLLHLLGHSEVTVAGAPVPFHIRRKHWYVTGLVATAPNCEIGRKELAETVWPLSDFNSQTVLLHTWKRSITFASTPFLNVPPVTITERHVSINSTCVGIDYLDCLSLANIARNSRDGQAVLEAGTAFDTLAEDKILLPSFPDEFVEIRRQFDILRMEVLRRSWQAEAHLHPGKQSKKSKFELRLSNLGDLNGIGNSAIPFKALPAKSPAKKLNRPSGAQLTAAAIGFAIIVTAIILGYINTPQKTSDPAVLSLPVNKPISDLSRNVLFQLGTNDIKQSIATAIAISPAGQIIAAGMATKTNGDHQSITVMLTKSGKVRWATPLNDDRGIKTTPQQIYCADGGRIYVAARLTAQSNNARSLAPGSYMSVNVYTADGRHVFARIHPVALAAANQVKLISDQKGGVYAFGSSATNQSPEMLHITSGLEADLHPQRIAFPKGFRLTDAIANDKDHIFLLGHLPVKTRTGIRMDWHVQAINKATKTLWSRGVTGADGQFSTTVSGKINAEGNLVVYGPLPSLDKRNGGRMVASLVTLSPLTGDVILRDCFDSENQNLNFALCCLPIGKSVLIAATTYSPTGLKGIIMHRFGNAKTDTALTLTVGLPNDERVAGILSFFIDSNGAANILLRPHEATSPNAAMTYVRKFFGREVSTGSLTTTVPFAYTTGGAGYVAGHYNNAFSVYYFGLLP